MVRPGGHADSPPGAAGARQTAGSAPQRCAAARGDRIRTARLPPSGRLFKV